MSIRGGGGHGGGGRTGLEYHPLNCSQVGKVSVRPKNASEWKLRNLCHQSSLVDWRQLHRGRLIDRQQQEGERGGGDGDQEAPLEDSISCR